MLRLRFQFAVWWATLPHFEITLDFEIDFENILASVRCY